MNRLQQRILENFLFFIGFGLILISHAMAEPVIDEPVMPSINPYDAASGELYFQNNQGYSASTLMNTDVDINVTGLLAKAIVKQHFINQTIDWQEALYVFPLPENSAVHRMRIRVGERIIEGEIKEKSQARKTYNQAKAQGKRTALVEQKRPNMFTTEIAHIAPGDEVTVEIEYLQQLVLKDNRVQLRFPTTITPRYNPSDTLVSSEVESDNEAPSTIAQGWQRLESSRPPLGPVVLENEVDADANRINLSLKVAPGFEIDGLHSLTHTLKGDFIDNTETGGHYEVSLRAGSAKMNRDFVVEWSPIKTAQTQVALFTERRDGVVYGSMLLTAPKTLEPSEGAKEVANGAEFLPRELIFVVDTSGSMGGAPIANARNVLHRALDGLRPQDKFNVIRFSSTASAFWHRALEVNANNLQRAHRYVDGLQSGGGTEMSQALSMALNTHYSGDRYLRQVVFITDGSVGNEQALFQQIEQSLGDNRLFTVGIGSAPNSYFMRKAAEFGRGSFSYVDDQSQIEAVVGTMLKKIGEPVLRDITIDWGDGGGQAEIYPPRIPDLYAGDPLAFSFRLVDEDASTGDKNNTEMALTIAGIKSGTGIKSHRGEWSKKFRFNSPEVAKSDETIDSAGMGLDKLWARSKIAFLKDEHVRGVSAEESRKQVLAVALRYGLVSDVTSLVAVDKTPVREAADSTLEQSKVPGLLPKGLKKGMARYPSTYTGSLSQILLGLFGLAMGVGYWLCSQGAVVRRYSFGGGR